MLIRSIDQPRKRTVQNQNPRKARTYCTPQNKQARKSIYRSIISAHLSQLIKHATYNSGLPPEIKGNLVGWIRTYMLARARVRLLIFFLSILQVGSNATPRLRHAPLLCTKKNHESHLSISETRSARHGSTHMRKGNETKKKRNRS
jgi:hypothetical protein